MLRKGLAFLLVLILLLSAVSPALAENQAMPDYVPVGLNVLSVRADHAKIMELEGLYRDQVLYFDADTICKLTGATVASSTAEQVKFNLHSELRQITVDKEGWVHETCNGRTHRTMTDAVSYEGEVYVSAWDMLTYMGAVVEFGQDEKAEVHLFVHMPYTLLDLYVDGMQANFHRFGWGEADGKGIDPESMLGLAALDTLFFGYESNLIAYVSGSYIDHIEKTIYAEALMDILYTNEVANIAPADPWAGISDAIASGISLPMPWLQKALDLHSEAGGKPGVGQGIGISLDVAGGALNTLSEMINAYSAAAQYRAMSNTLQNLLRDTLCRVEPDNEIYKQLPLLFDAASEINGIVQGTYTDHQAALEEALLGIGNIGASLINSNLPAAIWSTLANIVSMDYEDDGSFLNDEKRIVFADTCSDISLLAYQLLQQDVGKLVDAVLALGQEDTQLQKNMKMDIILCLKASIAARKKLLETDWLTDESRAAMERKILQAATLLNKAETAAAIPLGMIEPLNRDIAWIEKLHLLDGLTVVHPLFSLRKGFIKKIKQKETVPEGYIPIYSYEDFKVIADSCPSSTAKTAKKPRLTKENQAKYILMNDIKMPAYYDTAAVFAGVLDGNGYTMKNVSKPLFGMLHNATVKNLALNVYCTYIDEEEHVRYGGYASNVCEFGFIAQNIYISYGTDNVIDNCSVTGSASIRALNIRYGSIIGGRGNATITNCYSDVDVTIYAQYGSIGGIGCFGNSYYNCINEGDISYTITLTEYGTNSNEIGGIGARYNSSTDTCYNSGDIYVNLGAQSGGYAGGIIGEQSAYSENGLPDIINCYNTGDITLAGNTIYNRIAGGITASCRPDDLSCIKYCWNSGNITATTAGGIAGYGSALVPISDCSNLGHISGSENTGGIVGSTDRNNVLTRCVNAGAVSGSTEKTGNLVGNFYSSSPDQAITATDCYAVNSTLPLAYPYISAASSVKLMALEDMADRKNLDKLDFETLWIIRNHLPIPLYHDRTIVLSIDYSSNFIVPPQEDEKTVAEQETPVAPPAEADLSAQSPAETAPVSGVETSEQTAEESPQSTTPAAAPLDFQMTKMTRGKTYKVYSAASTKSWQRANGKASVSTNGDVWAAGWENGWLLVYYETSKGSVRVGYIDGNKISGTVDVQTQLEFAHAPATIVTSTQLTDDIARAATTITTLKAGAEVTYLTTFHTDRDWAYIETTYQKKIVRAFVPLEALALTETP